MKCDRSAGILITSYSFYLPLAIIGHIRETKKILLIITERGGWIARLGFIHLRGQLRRMILILNLKLYVLTK